MARPGPIYSRIPGRPAALILLYPNSAGQTEARAIDVQSIGATPGADGEMILSHLRGRCPPHNQTRTFIVARMRGALDGTTGAAITDLSQWFRDDAAARIARARSRAAPEPEPVIIEEHATIEIAVPRLRLPPMPDPPPPPELPGWMARNGLALAVLLALAGAGGLLLLARPIGEQPLSPTGPAPPPDTVSFYPDAAFWIGIGIACDPARTNPLAAMDRIRDSIALREGDPTRGAMGQNFTAGLLRGYRPLPDRVCERGIAAARAALREGGR